jgi:hypothetical protein
MDAQPPSIFLPELKRIKTCSKQEASDAIARLRFIYLSQVRGSTRRRHLPESQLPSRRSETKVIENNIEHIRADAFERSFSIQWLTRFISIYSEFIEVQDQAHADALEDAASLLAICAGVAASGTVTRTFAFPLPRRRSGPDLNWGNALSQSADTYETAAVTDKHHDPFGNHNEANEIRVVLRDVPLESADFSSVGAQTWGGSCVLAEMIVENPEHFGIPGDVKSDGFQIHRPFRALELGAGTGLGCLALGKILEQVSNQLFG